MMDEYMKKYNNQMEKVTLSKEADQRILADMLKADAEYRQSQMKYKKRGFSAAAVAGIAIMASSATVFAGVAIHGTIVKSKKAEAPVEGVGAHVDVGESYYYDLLAGVDGSIYALTDNDYEQTLTEEHAIAWKSTDQANSWESVLVQPEELRQETHVFAGDLYEGQTGIEAVILVEEDTEDGQGYTNRVYQVRAEDYVELDMTDVSAEVEEHLFNVKYVNADTLALIGTTKCVFYNLETQEVVKTVPYDLTMGCLVTQDQFLLYGKEVYTCLDIRTLEEQQPEAGLQEFVKAMYQYNDNEVLPQMTTLGDTIVCVAKRGIYEYQNGTTTEVKVLEGTAMDDGHAYNGLMPMCKTNDGEYYVCKFSDQGMTLWQVDKENEELK